MLFALAMLPCTTTSLAKLAKFAVTRLPKLAFNEVILPLKLAVFPSRLLVILTLFALAILP